MTEDQSIPFYSNTTDLQSGRVINLFSRYISYKPCKTEYKIGSHYIQGTSYSNMIYRDQITHLSRSFLTVSIHFFKKKRHYENTPVQKYRKFHRLKLKDFR